MKKVAGFLLGIALPFAAVIVAPFLALHDLVTNLTSNL